MKIQQIFQKIIADQRKGIKLKKQISELINRAIGPRYRAKLC
ncbi:hypothetical protein EV13_1554 [Prochlorococcus sp. MIT 0702]|nr:hypothetical protein EV13_1554 [Prochlorococcus sp. MIT 0702]KGG28616.1 hypothetical protein EV12_0511 [Prochlorococcus sp. MIT 0701]KGG30537.1 hypothetical protein EV14_3025 [Prochlorococcus sp. MIT 0703]